MRLGLALAITASVMLIGVAAWWRFADIKPGAPVIVSVEQPQEEDYEAIIRDLTEPAPGASTTTASSTPEVLTDTDIITRNLLLSYMGASVSTGGAVNTNTIDTIATQYVDQVASLHTFEKVNAQSIYTVADSRENDKIYVGRILEIYKTQGEQISTVSRGVTSVNSDSAYISLVGSVSAVYSGTATALKALPVPISFASLHIELINGQLSNAAAMKSAQKIEEDPMAALAGLIAMQENTNRETLILGEITRTLKEKWGII